MHRFRVAIKAGMLRNPLVSRLDLDRLVEVPQSERQRMEKAVICFRDPLSDGVMRKVAIIANCNVAMARILPRIVVTLHNVTVRTCCWIVA